MSQNSSLNNASIKSKGHSVHKDKSKRARTPVPLPRTVSQKRPGEKSKDGRVPTPRTPGKKVDTSQLSTMDTNRSMSEITRRRRRLIGEREPATVAATQEASSRTNVQSKEKGMKIDDNMKKAWRVLRTLDETTAQNKSEEDVDYPSFLDKHFETIQPGVMKMQYTYKEYISVITDAMKILEKEPTLVDVEPVVHVVGDIHGQFNDLINIFILVGRPPEVKYVFLGDYVDRGYMSIECIMLLLAYKVCYPDSITLLRGNHECARVNYKYGFHDECTEWIENGKGEEIWALFQRCFNLMPICALIGTKILCMHGGISPTMTTLQDLRDYPKPIRNPHRGTINDMLWADMDTTIQDWRLSGRGSGFDFGPQALNELCNRFEIDLVVRGHQMVLDGFWLAPSKKLLTLFSAPYYTNALKNAGGVLKVKADLCCQIIAMVPESKGCKERIVKTNRVWDKTVDVAEQED